jgi:hypothetical protein
MRSAYNEAVNDARAALMRSQKKKIDLQAAVIRGEVVPRAKITAVVNLMVGNFRSRALGITSKLVGKIPEILEHREMIDLEIHEALDELASEETLERIMDGLRELPADDRGSPSDLEAAAETDGERVGGPKQKALARIERRARKMVDEKGRVPSRADGRVERSEHENDRADVGRPARKD